MTAVGGSSAPKLDPFAQPSSGTAGVAPTSGGATSKAPGTSDNKRFSADGVLSQASGDARSNPAFSSPGRGENVKEDA